MKRSIRVLPFVIAVAAMFTASGCRRGGAAMSSDQMMAHMRNDPQMMQQMTDQMMKDPKIMQQMMDHMMKDPKSTQAMMDSMMKDPKVCLNMMDKMIDSPEHRRMMVGHMAKNAATCTKMMQEMSARMDEPAAKKMMEMCRLMMKESDTKTSAAASPPASVATSAKGVQEQVINVGDGFSPASLTVQKGKPVRLHFRRGSEPSCATEVVFPELNIQRPLPENSTATVEFTPNKTGTLAFGCGMNMLSGKVIVQ